MNRRDFFKYLLMLPFIGWLAARIAPGWCAERARSGKWEGVRKAFAADHPACEFCGQPGQQVHHVLPFHLHPDRELDPANLIMLCDHDHLAVGHLRNFKSYNPRVRDDCARMQDEVKNRPKPEPSVIGE